LNANKVKINQNTNGLYVLSLEKKVRLAGFSMKNSFWKHIFNEKHV